MHSLIDTDRRPGTLITPKPDAQKIAAEAGGDR